MSDGEKRNQQMEQIRAHFASMPARQVQRLRARILETAHTAPRVQRELESVLWDLGLGPRQATA